MRNAKVIAGSSHEELSALIVQKLGMHSAPITVTRHANHETAVELEVSVRNQDIFIIQSGSDNVNDHFMELLILINSCRSSSAGRITAILPYLPYSKQSKRKRSRGAITAKLVANMLTVAGADHIITMDLHHDQMQGFFSKPVDNLLSEPTFCKYIHEYIVPTLNVALQDVVIVSKNPGGVKRVTNLADRLRCDFAIIHQDNSVPAPSKLARKKSTSMTSTQLLAAVSKQQAAAAGNGSPAATTVTTADTASSATGSTYAAPMESAGPVKLTPLPADPDSLGGDDMHMLEVIEREWHEDGLQLVGDVSHRVCLIVDDIVDRADSFMSAAALLERKGAARVYVMGTHGLLSGDALAQFEMCSAVHEVIVTNTYPIPPEKREQSTKLRVIDISSVIAEAIRRTHNGESISYLFHTAI